MNASLQRQQAANKRYLVYATVASPNLSELQRLSTKSFGVVEFVSTAGLVFAISRVDELCEPQNASAAQIADFSLIVNELHRLTDILPFRFGAVLNLEQMKELAQQRGAVYFECLKRVQGCSEINSHWPVRPPENVIDDESIARYKQATSSGGDYLRRKFLNGKFLRSMEESASVVAISLANEMGAVLKDTNVSTRSLKNTSPTHRHNGTQVIVSINLLVQRDAVSHVMDILRSTVLESVFPVLVTGPWPAFSFLNEMDVESNVIDLWQCKGVQSNAA